MTVRTFAIESRLSVGSQETRINRLYEQKFRSLERIARPEGERPKKKIYRRYIKCQRYLESD